MSTYQPSIPTGLVNLNVDYQNIRDNFQQLDTSFGVDHIPFSQTAQNGYHTVIHFNPPSTTVTNPATNVPPNGVTATSGFGQLFSPQVTDGYDTDEALYFLTGGGKMMKLTSNTLPVIASNGHTFLAGGVGAGLILQWGVVNSPGAGGTVTFASNPSNVAFSTSLFSVQLTLRRPNVGTGAGVVVIDNGLTFDRTQFSYICSSAGNNALYWVALGA